MAIELSQTQLRADLDREITITTGLGTGPEDRKLGLIVDQQLPFGMTLTRDLGKAYLTIPDQTKWVHKVIGSAALLTRGVFFVRRESDYIGYAFDAKQVLSW